MAKKISEKEIKSFQRKIRSFYKKNKRNLPWRKTTDPYKILVSEIMLQQTQVDRVIPYYQRFLNTFPTTKDSSTHSLLPKIPQHIPKPRSIGKSP